MANISRRRVLQGAAIGSGLTLLPWLPAWAQPVSVGITTPLPTLSGTRIALRIARQTLVADGRRTHAIGINGTVPGPLLRLREGTTVRFAVTNDLDESSSVHWHGVLVPADMDGVPGVSFPGIAAHSTFLYEFPLKQAGTYWYHSHTGLQEQLGHYGPILIDPAGADPVAYDREHVIVLSDHSAMSPHEIFRRLKLEPDYFDYQKQTLVGLLEGRDQSLAQRVRWAAMRMSPTDISDVTGATYSYLVNGHGPADNWTALFAPGERVRLRLINTSAMTTFNVRIPGLPMTVVQADGQDVRPVHTDEIQVAVAETYDVIIVPPAGAYTLVGEAMDRSGMARATLTSRLGLSAPVPPLRKRPLASLQDMGMAGMTMAGGGKQGMDQGAMADMPDMPDMPDMAGMPGMHARSGGAMDMNMRDASKAPQVRMGPGVQTIAPMPRDRTGERGQGLEDVGHRVLVYRDLVALNRNPDLRAPSRTLAVHLTGNMERYMWSFDGVKLSDARSPLPFRQDERVRVTLVNDTMMGHPIHLHGHFYELVTGHADHAPRKHTVMVQPGGTVTFDLTANALGDWAFHCHLLYHMHAGMMRIVSIRPVTETPA
ncbi:MAG TPA: copper resistance system multicopper oxidase [Steroidobacteraceae bacterium]|nr:copper resistance system multicopper oxidase [Steroidobacteraceae bacterium]